MNELSSDSTVRRRPHVLFLNGAAGFGADVAVHASIARYLDRHRVRVSAATNIRESVPGVSTLDVLSNIPDMTVVPLDLGQPLGTQRGAARVRAIASNLQSGLSLIQLALWCRRNHVDLIHVTERPRQTFFGILVAKLAGCALLIHAHTTVHPGEAPRLVRWRLNQADAVVGVSRFTAESYPRYADVPVAKVRTVHNAVDVRLFTPQTAAGARVNMRQRLGLPPDVPVVACVARLLQGKAQHVLLDAFREVHTSFPAARLVLPGICGDAAPDGVGDYKNYLERRAKELGIADAVSFPGFLSQTDMPAFYGAIDVLAHPSIEEPFGLVLVEAMAAGKPVVAVEEGGVPEIIRNERDGLLVKARDSRAMAMAIIRVLEDPAESLRLGLAGRDRVTTTFTPERQAEDMLDVYEQVLGARAGQTMKTLTFTPARKGTPL